MTAENPAEAPPAPAAPIPVSGEVDVRVLHGSVLTHNSAADYGAYFTITFAGTEAPLPLLPYDVNRSRAYITCTGTGPVYVGSAAGVTAMRNGQVTGQAPAYILPSGITLQVFHKQPLWIAPDGTHTAIVSVAAERWAS